VDTQHIEQALLNAGFTATTQRPGIIYGGFLVNPEDNGDVLVTHVAGEFTGQRVDTTHRRKITKRSIGQMEKALSRQGWKVTMFEPTEGSAFWLRVTAEDAAYQLPGETAEAYLDRRETESDRAAWAAQDR
jgi:hypothetical protein